jgi:phage shock protein PspC (stress-responsive transcriptional regulator)
MTSTGTAESPLTAASPAARSRLTRSRTDKMLGGVAGGLSEHTGVDAVLWRVAFIALTVAGGSGILAYALLWLLMPAGEEATR